MKEYLFLLATAPHSSLLASIVAFYSTTASWPGGGTSERGDINIRERLGEKEGREGGRRESKSEGGRTESTNFLCQASDLQFRYRGPQHIYNDDAPVPQSVASRHNKVTLASCSLSDRSSRSTKGAAGSRDVKKPITYFVWPSGKCTKATIVCSTLLVQGYLDLASSPGPTQKSGKGPGVTCKNSRMCCVSSLRLE